MKNKVVRIAVWLLIFFLAWMALSSWSLAAPRIAFRLVVGWMGFLARVIPAMEVNWSGIGMAVACSVLIVAGLHSLAVWIFGHVTRTLKQMPASNWRWSWSVALYLGLWLVFMAIMGAVGVAHQVGWLVRSKEPLMVQREYRGAARIDLQEFGRDLAEALDSSRWKADSVREAIMNLTSWVTRHAAVEDYHFVPLGSEQGKVTAVAIVPGTPLRSRRTDSLW